MPSKVPELEQEIAFFEAHRQEFLKIAPEKFALVKGDQNHGFFDTAENAYKKGVELFGLEPFLIREVLSEDPLQDIPAHFLGLIYAGR